MYITNTPLEHAELHVVSGGQSRVVNTMPRFPATGCESRPACEHFSLRFTYSPNGAYVSLVGNIGRPSFRLWTSDGKLLKSIDIASVNDYTANPSMSVWSGNALYWRDARGVEMWRDGTESLVLPGVAWIGPQASPGGGYVLFQTRDSSGTAHIAVLDTASGKTKELKASRSAPHFLNSHLIWYREERACVSGDPFPCGPDSTTIETGKTYILDLLDNTESESVIAEVFDVWPRAA
jgi:hypothetical protein